MLLEIDEQSGSILPIRPCAPPPPPPPFFVLQGHLTPFDLCLPHRSQPASSFLIGQQRSTNHRRRNNNNVSSTRKHPPLCATPISPSLIRLSFDPLCIASNYRVPLHFKFPPSHFPSLFLPPLLLSHYLPPHRLASHTYLSSRHNRTKCRCIWSIFPTLVRTVFTVLVRSILPIHVRTVFSIFVRPVLIVPVRPVLTVPVRPILTFALHEHSLMEKSTFNPNHATPNFPSPEAHSAMRDRLGIEQPWSSDDTHPSIPPPKSTPDDLANTSSDDVLVVGDDAVVTAMPWDTTFGARGISLLGRRMYFLRKRQQILRKSYEECRRITALFSKTFYMGTALLSPEKQHAVWAIYMVSTNRRISRWTSRHSTQWLSTQRPCRLAITTR